MRAGRTKEKLKMLGYAFHQRRMRGFISVAWEAALSEDVLYNFERWGKKCGEEVSSGIRAVSCGGRNINSLDATLCTFECDFMFYVLSNVADESMKVHRVQFCR